jgi:hypothetical protein
MFIGLRGVVLCCVAKLRNWVARTHGYGLVTKPLLMVAGALLLSACGGNSGSVPEDDVCTTHPNALAAASMTRVQPEDIPANSEVTLSLTGIGLPEKASVMLASEPCFATQGLTAQTFEARCQTRESGHHWLTVYAHDACASAQGVASLQVMVSDRATSSLLPASGLGSGQCYAVGSDEWVDCGSALAQQLSPSQDGMKMMPVPQFSTLQNVLTGTRYTSEECIQDPRTSLVWEGKTKTGFRAGHHRYIQTHLGLDNSSDLALSEGHTDHYLARVNRQKLCGFDDWRLPSAEELQGLLNYGVAVPGPLWSSQDFPNTPNEARYWTATPYADSTLLHWYVDFASGVVSIATRQEGLSLRLVRGPAGVSFLD